MVHMAIGEEISASLAPVDAELERRYPGDPGTRQPVHTVVAGPLGPALGMRAHEDRLSGEVRSRIELNPLRAFDSDDPGTQAVMADAPRLLDRLTPEDAEHFDEVKGLLDMAARPMAALYIGGMGAKGKNFYNALACRYGYEKEAGEIQDLYLSGKKAEAAALVPDDLLESTSLCGPEGYLKERIAAFKEAGVTMLNVTPVGGNPLEIMEKLKAWSS